MYKDHFCVSSQNHFHSLSGVVDILCRFQLNLLTNSVSWLLIQPLMSCCIILRNLRHLWVFSWVCFS